MQITMITIEKTETYGWEAAVRGMRNPKNSWDKSDSTFLPVYTPPADYVPEIGENDLALMKTLAAAGTDHGKFLRMITVTVDLTAPFYWWKEFDTYKVGTVADSCSTMHKIHAKEFTLDDFSHEHLIDSAVGLLLQTIDALNDAREIFVNYDNYPLSSLDPQITCRKDVWWQLIQLLPSSYNQKRTVQVNYQVLKNMYHARKNHKLDEWHTLCEWIEGLPYSELITG